MDRKLQHQQEIERLIRLSGNARSCLGNEVTALKHRLDVPARLRDSLKIHPTGWLFGSAGAGLAASLLFRRKPARTEKKAVGLPLKILGLMLTVARPMAKVWLSGQVKDYLAGTPRGSKGFTHPARDHTASPTPF